MSEPLFAGLKVVDAASVIAAPAAAMMLADFGADVIKIEKPGRGDMLRILSNMPGTPEECRNYMWDMDGRNKRSIALNLKTEHGKQILHELADWCDVFITNMPYPSRIEFNATYEDLKVTNPTIVYASLTAYGELGEERDRKAFDQLAYWARSGLMDLMREPGTKPTQGLPGMGDHPTAVAIYAGIVTALLKRERTGEGSFVQTSLLANGLWSNAAIAQGAMAGADMERYRDATEVPGVTMQGYQAKDGRWLQLNMIRTEQMLSILFTVMGAEGLLVDPRFASMRDMYRNRREAGEAIQAIIETRTSGEWMELFEEAELPVNLMAVVEESAKDAQVLENRIAMVPNENSVGVPLLLNHPLQVSGVEHVPTTAPPGLGEHSKEILRELGYDQNSIEELIETGAVATLSPNPS
ncbi:MAG: CaiB/BaiF CoA-transferase family protein [Gammaproteobacteria bacterium]|nr:CaiB/BaiF CoA-transferase family protein [Gammaproteobacteria bacterium]